MHFDFINFLKEVDDYNAFHTDQRYGQAFMNVLFDKNTRIYHAILGTKYDPFYDDKRIDIAKEKVQLMSLCILNKIS